uniref:Uncharacterized protein n=1 Tax=Oryza meridionalis TaxID=40149 RepID=A0A0E0F9Z5_9ORYZ
MLDNPLFEIDLKVNGQGPPSEDKALSYYVFPSECHRHRFSICTGFQETNRKKKKKVFKKRKTMMSNTMAWIFSKYM